MKTKKLHHRSKQFEIQQYDHRNLAWYPVAHTTTADKAVERLRYGVQKGYYTRIVDRLTGGTVEAGKPLVPRYECTKCADTKECIIDSADHNGEHRQDVYPCECTLEE